MRSVLSVVEDRRARSHSEVSSPSEKAKGQAALDRALSEDNLVLVYQPIHDARTRRIVAAEALLRQRRESGEIREAGIITSAAEHGPDLYTLDSWTTRSAYRDAAEWQARGGGDVRLNVNLSPREFQEGNVLARLRKLLPDANLLQKLNLEITEASYIDDPKETRHILQDLKDAGIALWLDDFGSGHSSLEHLQSFPVDGLKLPSLFVAPIERDDRSRKIVRSLLSLAHDLGLEVIAEGVERQAQLDFLLEHGCEYIQGFFFSKPMTLEELEEMLGGKERS